MLRYSIWLVSIRQTCLMFSGTILGFWEIESLRHFAVPVVIHISRQSLRNLLESGLWIGGLKELWCINLQWLSRLDNWFLLKRITSWRHYCLIGKGLLYL